MTKKSLDDIIENRKRLEQIEEDELALSKQKNYLEELEEDLVRLQHQEREIFSLLDEGWQSNQGRDYLYATEQKVTEQQKALYQEIAQQKEHLDEKDKELLHKRVKTERTLEQLKRDVNT